MSLSDVASVFQIVGTLGTLAAAVAAAVSARASSRSASHARTSQRLAVEQALREHRPTPEVSITTLDKSTPVNCALEFTNEHAANIARDVIVQVKRPGLRNLTSPQEAARIEQEWIDIIETPVLHPGKGKMHILCIYDRVITEDRVTENHESVKTLAFQGRAYFSDDLGLARYSSTFGIMERAYREDGDLHYIYDTTPMTTPQRLDQDDDAEGGRLRTAWAVLRRCE